MGHDNGLLMLAIESILADCGRVGLPWEGLVSDAKPARLTPPCPSERRRMKSAGRPGASAQDGPA